MSAEGFAEVLGEVIDGHDLKDDMAKDSLPAVADDLASRRWNDPFEGVEEAVLSGVDGMDHGVSDRPSRLFSAQQETVQRSPGWDWICTFVVAEMRASGCSILSI